VAGLFALSGAISFGLLYVDQAGMYLGGITFGLVAAYLFGCAPMTWSPIVILTDAVWYGSVHLTIYLIQDHSWNTYLAMAAAGVLGGAAVAASIGVGCRGVLSPRVLLAAGFAGGLAALPLGWWEHHAEITGIVFFPAWQVLVGLAMWRAAATRVADKDR
jgi:hypothetical protein